MHQVIRLEQRYAVVQPDAAELMWADVKSGRKTKPKPYDDDNDGRTGEDGPEDLNGDGRITLMRVADPTGAYVLDPDEARLMKQADAAKGESSGASGPRGALRAVLSSRPWRLPHARHVAYR